VVRGETTVTRPAVDRESWDGVIAFARAALDERLHGAAPAPYRALDLLALAKDAPFADGTAAEDEALADLALSDELRNGLYAFDLVQRRAKRPAGAPDKALARPVTKVGIVGAGLMASQLGLLFAQRLEVPVVLTDLDQTRVAKGLSYVYGEIDKLAAKGRLDPARRPSCAAWSPATWTRRPSPTPTSWSRRCSRSWASRSRSGPRWRSWSRPSACWRPTPRRCRSPRWRPTWSTPSGWSGCTSSTRSR
jgi:hypothetical protein